MGKFIKQVSNQLTHNADASKCAPITTQSKSCLIRRSNGMSIKPSLMRVSKTKPNWLNKLRSLIIWNEEQVLLRKCKQGFRWAQPAACLFQQMGPRRKLRREKGSKLWKENVLNRFAFENWKLKKEYFLKILDKN